jgi:hypothetical protein
VSAPATNLYFARAHCAVAQVINQDRLVGLCAFSNSFPGSSQFRQSGVASSRLVVEPACAPTEVSMHTSEYLLGKNTLGMLCERAK